jgi:hypothetical protein
MQPDVRKRRHFLQIGFGMIASSALIVPVVAQGLVDNSHQKLSIGAARCGRIQGGMQHE